MTIRTINHIETSSICDNSCRYCPAKDVHLHRPTGFMSQETFDRVMEWVKYFTRKGTQTEVNLYGIGESTLNPLLPSFIRQARSILPMRYAVHINTNGAWIDTSTPLITNKELEFAQSLKDAGINHVDITGHDAFKAAKAKRVLQSVNISGGISFDFIVNPNNWAGQVDWFKPTYDAGKCPWIHGGQAFIMSEGQIARCCIDAFGTDLIGNVHDDIRDIETGPMELCKNCHHTI
jgi:hypothetical protein